MQHEKHIQADQSVSAFEILKYCNRGEEAAVWFETF